jgi:hypothetical protein
MLKVQLTLEYDFINADTDGIREAIMKQDESDYELVYEATQRFIEHITKEVTTRHDIPADTRIMIERMKAYIEEAAETFLCVYEEQVGDA